MQASEGHWGKQEQHYIDLGWQQRFRILCQNVTRVCGTGAILGENHCKVMMWELVCGPRWRPIWRYWMIDSFWWFPTISVTLLKWRVYHLQPRLQSLKPWKKSLQGLGFLMNSCLIMDLSLHRPSSRSLRTRGALGTQHHRLGTRSLTAKQSRQYKQWSGSSGSARKRDSQNIWLC